MTLLHWQKDDKTTEAQRSGPALSTMQRTGATGKQGEDGKQGPPGPAGPSGNSLWKSQESWSVVYLPTEDWYKVCCITTNQLNVFYAMFAGKDHWGSIIFHPSWMKDGADASICISQLHPRIPISSIRLVRCPGRVDAGIVEVRTLIPEVEVTGASMLSSGGIAGCDWKVSEEGEEVVRIDIPLNSKVAAWKSSAGQEVQIGHDGNIKVDAVPENDNDVVTIGYLKSRGVL